MIQKLVEHLYEHLPNFKQTVLTQLNMNSYQTVHILTQLTMNNYLTLHKLFNTINYEHLSNFTRTV